MAKFRVGRARTEIIVGGTADRPVPKGLCLTVPEGEFLTIYDSLDGSAKPIRIFLSRYGNRIRAVIDAAENFRIVRSDAGPAVAAKRIETSPAEPSLAGGCYAESQS